MVWISSIDANVVSINIIAVLDKPWLFAKCFHIPWFPYLAANEKSKALAQWRHLNSKELLNYSTNSSVEKQNGF